MSMDKMNYNSTHPRYEKLDIIRGGGMLWVIFVHCLYWMGLFNEGRRLVIKSLFLLEMPIMFFAIGASNSFSRSTSYFNFVFRRIKRVYLPYLAYVLICWIMTVETTGITDGSSRLMPLFMMTGFPIYVPGNAASALWFMPHYCMFILMFPAFRWIHQKTHSLKSLWILPYAFFMLGMLLVSFHAATYWNYFFAYGFWVYLGLDYIPLIEKKSHWSKWWTFLVSLICLIALLILHYKCGFGIDMQANKFPPNIMFWCYTIFALALLLLISDRLFALIIKVKNKSKFIDEICSTYEKCSFSIFLIQPFAFAMVNAILRFLSLSQVLMINDVVSVIIYFMLAVPVAALMGKCFFAIEKRCK